VIFILFTIRCCILLHWSFSAEKMNFFRGLPYYIHFLFYGRS
jgi:hypothetical protein